MIFKRLSELLSKLPPVQDKADNMSHFAPSFSPEIFMGQT